MRKVFKSLLGVVLALVMCLTMAPATTAKADEAVALSEYTENQLLTAFMGEWEGTERGEYAILSRNHIKMWNDEYDKTFIDTDWTYEGLVEVETTKLTWADWEAWMNGETNTYKTKALKFTGGGYVVYLYVEYSEWAGERVLRVKYTNETAEIDSSRYLMVKNVSEDEQCYVDELLEASLTATETPAEEPNAEEPVEETPVEEPTPAPTETPVEEPTETPVEEPKTEEPTETPTVETGDKEIVEKTKDGRAVYTGETVYIVKKGDCLWNIAKQLLGNGARYKELFTRNNGIIEKAKLIFPGQEVIVPAK